MLWAGHRTGRHAADQYLDELADRIARSYDRAEPILLRGRTLAIFGRYEEAIEMFDYAGDVSDRGVEILLAAGHAHYAAGNLTEAERRFSSVLEKDPDNIEALVERGSVYLDRGDSDKAKADYARVDRLTRKESGAS